VLKYFQNKNSRKGFTLIEALVVIFIISLLAISILASYKNSNKKYILLQANQKIISDLRKVQNMAINGTEIEGYCSTVDACFGYGIMFDLTSPSSYILFADGNGNETYNAGEGFETVNLPSTVIIQSIFPSPKAHVFFEAPDPITYVNGDSGASASAEIVIQIQGTALTKTINVNTAGLIENN